MLTRMLALLLEEHNEILHAVTMITRYRDIDNLVKLFVVHAVDEERIMKEIVYSDYKGHKKAHDELVDVLKDLALDGTTNIIEFRYIIHQLITSHISEWDMILLNGLEMEYENRRRCTDCTRNEGSA